MQCQSNYSGSRDDPPALAAVLQAASQILDGKGAAARKTVDHLLDVKWEARFGKVRSRVGELLAKLGEIGS